MNVDRVKALADYIETNNCQLFDMENWLEVYDKESAEMMEIAEERATYLETSLPEGFCGTSGCIAGHCVVMAEGMEIAKRKYAVGNIGCMFEAQEYLGLPSRQAAALFVPRNTGWEFPRGLASIGKAEAVEALRKFAETGEVDWSHVEGAEYDGEY